MKAPFAYYGGKMGLAREIVSLLPDHDVYLEPFFGSGAVLFAKRPAKVEVVNDLDGGAVAFFRMLRARCEDLERVCALTPHARAEFDAALAPADDELERARRFWARVNQSFAKTAGPGTGWSVTASRSESVPQSIRGRLGRFQACAERLMDVSIESCDGVGLITRLARPGTVVYADPPYPYEARSGRSGRRTDPDAFSDYGTDMGGEEDHRRLAEVLHSTPATVFLSGYDCPLYAELYGDWDRAEFATTAHSSNAITSSRGRRTEVVWTNRPAHRPRLFSTG